MQHKIKILYIQENCSGVVKNTSFKNPFKVPNLDRVKSKLCDIVLLFLEHGKSVAQY